MMLRSWSPITEHSINNITNKAHDTIIIIIIIRRRAHCNRLAEPNHTLYYRAAADGQDGTAYIRVMVNDGIFKVTMVN